ncbi:MAG TPA: hypothetical protein VHX12_14475 [Acidisoma sp.]|jgi:hypothetical protein|nr:hypothetical protein [Acidisoma sp.]
MAYDPQDFLDESWAMRMSEPLDASLKHANEGWAPVSPTWANAADKTSFNMTLQGVSDCKLIAT